MKYKLIETTEINTRHALLYKDTEKPRTFKLRHYKHDILKVTNGKIQKLLPVSVSSRKAITQALRHLKITVKDLNDLCMKMNNGKDIKTLQEEWTSKIKTN